MVTLFCLIVFWIPPFKHLRVPCTAAFCMLNLSDFFFFYGLICDNIQDFQCGLRLSDLTLCPDISVSLIWLFLSQKLLIRTLLLITSAFIVFLIPFDTPPIITDWPVTCFSFEAQRKFIMHTCKTNWSRPIVFSLLPYSNSKYSMGLNLMESNRNLVIGI